MSTADPKPTYEIVTKDDDGKLYRSHEISANKGAKAIALETAQGFAAYNQCWCAVREVVTTTITEFNAPGGSGKPPTVDYVSMADARAMPDDDFLRLYDSMLRWHGMRRIEATERDHKRLSELTSRYRRPVQVLAKMSDLFGDTWADMAALVTMDADEAASVVACLPYLDVYEFAQQCSADEHWSLAERAIDLGRWVFIGYLQTLPHRDL